MAVRVAATLHVADHIAGGRRTATTMAAAESVEADVLDRVLRHLVSVGVLGRDDDGGYALGSAGEFLAEGHPWGLRALLDIEGGIGRAELAFVHLLHSVRTGEAGFPLLYGRGFWEDMASDATRTASYDAQMGADARRWAAQVVDALDWARFGSVIDVGGGNGTLLSSLLIAHPALRGTVFDQPATAEAARITLASAGVADRADVVAGSFFDPLPPGAGAYVLCAVLHDWPDDGARAILRRAAEAAGSTGRVVVIEKTGAGGESTSTDMDLRVLIHYGARERGVTELVGLAASVGLDVVAVHPAGDISIVELRPT
ncbi:MAG: 2,7-dihydroxy-5-methyl-naphthoate 7-O-methyltransferase [Actinomycetota bacterium]|nr:2,7-dihydroxy-5-methyl-naphthoate 7-O-methyltransferase [Actinomycetota bacterium]